MKPLQSIRIPTPTVSMLRVAKSKSHDRLLQSAACSKEAHALKTVRDENCSTTYCVCTKLFFKVDFISCPGIKFYSSE